MPSSTRPGEAEQVAVHRTRELRREGRSNRDIANVLDAEELDPRRSSIWSAMWVRNIAVREETAA